MVRHMIRAAAYVILIKDGKAFLMRRAGTGWNDGKYNLPAGHIESGETPSVAALRELKEEAGVAVMPEELRFAIAMHRKPEGETDFEYADYFFTAEKWQGEPRLMESDKCDEVGWFALDAIPENTIPYIKDALFAVRDGVNYLER